MAAERRHLSRSAEDERAVTERHLSPAPVSRHSRLADGQLRQSRSRRTSHDARRVCAMPDACAHRCESVEEAPPAASTTAPAASRTCGLFCLTAPSRLFVLNFHMPDDEPVIKSRAMTGLRLVDRGRHVRVRRAVATGLF